jgi:hypothetical protein
MISTLLSEPCLGLSGTKVFVGKVGIRLSDALIILDLWTDFRAENLKMFGIHQE